MIYTLTRPGTRVIRSQLFGEDKTLSNSSRLESFWHPYTFLYQNYIRFEIEWNSLISFLYVHVYRTVWAYNYAVEREA